jgi:AcrR family transcriptional regulator
MGLKERREREEQARLTSIVEAAERVFAANGYYQTRMDDIADAAELAKGTLYYYFKNKDAIYLHLLERESSKVLDEVKNRIPEHASFLETLRETIYFYLEYFERNPSFLKIFFPCMCGFIHMENASSLRKWTRKYIHHVDFIRQALEKKMARENAPFEFESLLKFIRTLYIGIGMKLLEGKKNEATAAANFFLDLMKRLMEDA